MRGVRLPVNLDQRVRADADAAGVKASTLIREWIELGLTELENDRPVSLSAPRHAIAAAQASRAPPDRPPPPTPAHSAGHSRFCQHTRRRDTPGRPGGDHLTASRLPPLPPGLHHAFTTAHPRAAHHSPRPVGSQRRSTAV
ncbi:hypothetical protein ACFY2R_20865 [Micromonospora olivasterospora]|uniref:hypothetical protein n=1 Tax=Micromonospora olivasterospora TaxID=1880 RepID=UPI0011A4D628|nr:hypothetical protein [Micromonospora olivasterospora]